MFSRRFVYWGLALFGVSAAIAALGLVARTHLGDAVTLPPQEALSRLADERAVVLSGRLSPPFALYNIAANTDVRRRTEMLRKSSPLHGVPLFGPDGVPQDKWDALIGSYVAVETKADGDPFLFHLKFQSPVLGGELIRQHIFLPLGRADLWTISVGRAIVGGFGVFQEDVPGSSGFPRRFTDDERRWLQGGVFRGHLHRLRDYSADQLTYAEMKRLYQSAGARRADALDQGWLLVQAPNDKPLLSGSGWHMYVPFENTNNLVWAQLPLATDPLKLPSEIRGVWLPPGSHSFRPNAAQDRVALVLAHPNSIQTFMSDAWLRHWSGIAVLTAAGLGAVAVALIAWGLIPGPNPVRRAVIPVVAASALLMAAGTLLWPPDSQQRMAAIIVASWMPIIILWAMAAWYRRRRCRDAGLLQYRQRAFAWPGVSEAKRYLVADRLSDRELLWAHFLPEHRPAARQIIRSKLQQRGYSEEAIDGWAPAPHEVTVPPAVEKPVSAKRYRRLVRVRRWCLYVYLGLAIPLACVAVLLGLAALGGTRGDVGQASAGIGLVMWVVAALSSFLLRRRALRILLLRPFGEKKMTRALKRFVCRNVGRTGLVFTLSDRNYKESFLILMLWRLIAEVAGGAAMLALGPILRASKRVASVKRERKFRKLQRHLLKTASPSFWSFINGSQAFNIRSSDSWWQMCIHMLMHSSEIIVVDLSRVKEGTAWELEQLGARNLLAKCVFIVGDEHREGMDAVLERYFPADSPPVVYVYRANGALLDRPGFDAHFDAIAMAGLARWGRPTTTAPALDASLVPA
jgi:hypothetical protein